MGTKQLRSWKITVQDKEPTEVFNRDIGGPDWIRFKHTHYVIASTKPSAIRQAKILAGYTKIESEQMKGVISCEIIETIEVGDLL